MIRLIGKPGQKTGCFIRFIPRPGFKHSHQLIERELVYGHYCSHCDNVVQAMFLTPEPIDLWPYEQTRVVTVSKDAMKNGQLLKTVPNDESKDGYSNYTVTMLKGQDEVAQHLTLKNHVLRYHGIDGVTGGRTHTDRFFEPGERTCAFTGVFSLQEQRLVQDTCAIYGGWSRALLAAHKLPDPTTFVKLLTEHEFWSLAAYGDAPPVILFPREAITSSWGYLPSWHLENNLKPFKLAA